MDVKALRTNIPNNENIAAVNRKHNNYTKKTVATKVITFLALILTLSNFNFNSKSYLQSKAVLWEQYASLNTQSYLCLSSKRDTSILSQPYPQTNATSICSLSTIFLWYGLNQKTNSNPS